MKQKTDVELLSEVTGIPVANIKNDTVIFAYSAREALILKSNQLQATVDELKNRCEELEKYVRHGKYCRMNDLLLESGVCTCGLSNLIENEKDCG